MRGVHLCRRGKRWEWICFRIISLPALGNFLIAILIKPHITWANQIAFCTPPSKLQITWVQTNSSAAIMGFIILCYSRIQSKKWLRRGSFGNSLNIMMLRLVKSITNSTRRFDSIIKINWQRFNIPPLTSKCMNGFKIKVMPLILLSITPQCIIAWLKNNLILMIDNSTCLLIE